MKMNAILLAVLGLLALSNHAYGIVCLPNACATVLCAAITEESCDGKFVPRGGYCGCCDACRTILKEGDSCALLLLHGPQPPKSECDTDLVCSVTTFKCEKADV